MLLDDQTTPDLPLGPTRRPSPSAGGWLPLPALPAAAVVVATAARWPRWGLMWALAVAIFLDCKWLTWRGRPRLRSPLWRHVGYWLAWPGLDAAAFLDRRVRPRRPAAAEWWAGLGKLVAGLTCLYGWARFLPPDSPYWLGWVGMVGIVLSLHFGSFALLSCAWRTLGVDARPLMNRPLASVRLADFWGLRWNTAFRDLTSRFLFRPLSRRLGGRGAVWVGFLFSGLVHDAVISVPAGGGYGGPTLYFLLQAAGLSVERTRPARRLGVGRGVGGWVYTMAFLLLPARLLFHEPFVVGVVLPFLHAIGAAP